MSKFVTVYEPRHYKTNKMSVRPAKTQISLGICPVWSESSLCAQRVAKDPRFLHADSEDSDRTGRMPRLIWVFAGHTLILLVLSCHGSYFLQLTVGSLMSCCNLTFHCLTSGFQRLVTVLPSCANYRKFPKYSDIQKIYCNHSEIWTMWLCHRVMSPNDADGMANSVDPDQTDLGLHCLPRPACPKT